MIGGARFAMLLAAVLAAQAAQAGPRIAGSHQVVEVVDGDTVVLADGSQVRLVGIQAPKLPLGRRNFKKWPLADEARAKLADWVAGRPVTLVYGGRERDRHGRRLAHLFLAAPRDLGAPDAAAGWIQGRLLVQGFARVYSFPDNRFWIADMLALERRARGARAGIWAYRFYRIRAPESLGSALGSFQLVEGRVLKVATVRGRTYLNYGDDWRLDFTVSFNRRAARLFERLGIDYRRFEGRSVRVRGWVSKRNGPAITLTHPEQIEMLEE